MTTTLIKEISNRIIARKNCARANCGGGVNAEWFAKHTAVIHELVKDFMPSGSGIDSGTKIDLDASTQDKLVFTFGYHHMAESGMYDGWTEHKAIVRPSLAFGYEIQITGSNRNQIKEYLHDVFADVLQAEIEWDNAAESYRAVPVVV